MGLKRFVGIFAILSVFAAGVAQAQIRISEWQYNGSEYIELTNYGGTPVDFAGWSYDDDSRIPGAVDLSSFGLVNPGEAVLITELAADDFRDEWRLPSFVKIVGDHGVNLGRNDEINIYDAANVLVDRLTYGDQNFTGTIRTNEVSGNPTSLAVLELDTVGAPGDWVLSFVGDSYGSYTSFLGGYIGNPGNVAPIPEPATVAMFGIAVIGFVLKRRTR